MSNLQLLECKHAIEDLIIYRKVYDDPVIKKLCELIDFASQSNGLIQDRINNARKSYYDFINMLVDKAEEYGFSGNIYKKFIISAFLSDENPFSIACEKHELNKKGSVYKLALNDVIAFMRIMTFDIDGVCKQIGESENIVNYVPNVTLEYAYLEQIETSKTKEDIVNLFELYYSNIGFGDVGNFKMFRYCNKELIKITNCDKSELDDIVGYSTQKQMLLSNVEAFLSGDPAHNVLLMGSRGTGKSTLVKALANRFFDRGLRLVEVNKDQLSEIPDLCRLLGKRGKKFVVFLDDLSFDEFEVQYKYLKSILEGGVERKPDNVIFIATSNRKNIIQQKWSDKDGMFDDDEIHGTDTMNEKLSLADRFGLTITFPQPSPDEFVKIVLELAKKKKLPVSDDIIRKEALSWDVSQRGMSGRAARQFIDNLICELNRQ